MSKQFARAFAGTILSTEKPAVMAEADDAVSSHLSVWIGQGELFFRSFLVLLTESHLGLRRVSSWNGRTLLRKPARVIPIERLRIAGVCTDRFGVTSIWFEGGLSLRLNFHKRYRGEAEKLVTILGGPSSWPRCRDVPGYPFRMGPRQM